MTAVEELIEAGRQVAELGISPGSSGNLSIRAGGRIWMTGTGTGLGRLGPDGIAVLDEEGAYLEGVRPSKEAPLHVAFYRKNPMHQAVVHLHSPHALAASCLEPWSATSALPPITPYFIMRVGQSPLLPFRRPGDPALGEVLLACPYDFHAALLSNHGQVTSGPDIGRALDTAVELEDACRTVLLTEGKARRLVPDDDVSALAERWGTPWQTPPPASAR